MNKADQDLLRVEGLVCAFRERARCLPVLDGVSFSLSAGETLCLVGESGCGKTMTALALMGLLPRQAVITGGSLRFQDRDLGAMSESERRAVRGGGMGMIFQEPMTSLNPVMKIGRQVGEALRVHRGLRGKAARAEAAKLLGEVGVPDSAERLDAYPHELSGGLRQRVMIAMALAGDPALLIADEPSTALDVTIQAQVLDLLSRLRARRGLAILLITHDLGVVAELGDRVLVMYAGQVVESAPVARLLAAPAHPYTQGLLASLPRMEGDLAPLSPIPGNVPSPGAAPSGCRFRDRCGRAAPECEAEQVLRSLDAERELRCCRAEAT